MPKIDLDTIEQLNTTGYPAPFHEPLAGRFFRRIGAATGLTALGVSHVVLKPEGWSSQRHWHQGEDEFLVMLAGEAVLIEDEGETVLVPGDLVSWPMGVRNGHHLVNRSDADCAFLCFSAGSRDAGGAYPDIDMLFTRDGFVHRDGTPYPPRARS